MATEHKNILIMGVSRPPTTAQYHTRSSSSMAAAPPAKVAAQPHTTLDDLADDELLSGFAHLAERDLAALACTCRKMLIIVSSERERRKKVRAHEMALERERLKRARAHFEAFEGDERLLRTVIRHMFVNAPAEHSINERKKLAPPSSGVCRLRVGIKRSGGITMDARKADWMVDVLAMQEGALRAVNFRGQPLGAAGAAVAVRQSRVPQLNVPTDVTLYGRVFKVFIRANVNDPEYLAKLMSDEPCPL